MEYNIFRTISTVLWAIRMCSYEVVNTTTVGCSSSIISEVNTTDLKAPWMIIIHGKQKLTKLERMRESDYVNDYVCDNAQGLLQQLYSKLV